MQLGIPNSFPALVALEQLISSPELLKEHLGAWYKTQGGNFKSKPLFFLVVDETLGHGAPGWAWANTHENTQHLQGEHTGLQLISVEEGDRDYQS